MKEVLIVIILLSCCTIGIQLLMISGKGKFRELKKCIGTLFLLTPVCVVSEIYVRYRDNKTYNYCIIQYTLYNDSVKTINYYPKDLINLDLIVSEKDTTLTVDTIKNIKEIKFIGIGKKKFGEKL